MQPDRGALISQCLERLYAFFYRRLRHHQDAEDLTHDTTLLVLAKWHQYDLSRPFWPWLVTIAWNRLVAVARREKKWKRHLPLIEDEDSTNEVATTDDSPDALEILFQREDHDRLRAEIDGLSPNHRETVLLYYFEELSVDEIAAIHHVSVGRIYGLLSEARARLRATLAEPGLSGR